MIDRWHRAIIHPHRATLQARLATWWWWRWPILSIIMGQAKTFHIPSDTNHGHRAFCDRPLCLGPVNSIITHHLTQSALFL